MIYAILLREHAAAYGIKLTDEMLSQFDIYADMLVERNRVMNLTAITDPQEILVKHFFDSLLLLDAVEVPESRTLIDIGTGAGFPGLPVKIARPDCRLTLLDSLQKRVTFLEDVTAAMKLADVECIHARAEDGGRNPKLREQFDFATARAVARLPVLCEYAVPFLKVGGSFCALKGYDIEEELKDSAHAIKTLGCVVAAVQKYTLPDDSRRSIVVITKHSPTAKAYPRNPGKISKAPL